MERETSPWHYILGLCGRLNDSQVPWIHIKGSSVKQTHSRKVSSTQRTSRAVTHPSTIRALRRLTSEFGWDPVLSTQCGRWQVWSTLIGWSLSSADPGSQFDRATFEDQLESYLHCLFLEAANNLSFASCLLEILLFGYFPILWSVSPCTEAFLRNKSIQHRLNLSGS